MKPTNRLLLALAALMIIAGCASPGAAASAPTSAPSAAAQPTPTAPRPLAEPTPSPTGTAVAPTATAVVPRAATPRPAKTATARPTQPDLPARDPADWENWPVVPEGVSSAMVALYQAGLESGNLSHRFSKVGDCQNISTYFLANYDRANRYDLGEYTSLQETIDWYAGSFKRDSVAVRGGLNVAAVQNPLFTRSKECKKGENPLACELRVNQPSVVLVSYEELWDGNTEKYERHYTRLIEFLLEQQMVPILATTANNESANRIIAGLAVRYDLPVWNLWAALQPLRRHGIVDGFHLTQWGNIFDFSPSQGTLSGWHMRNLTGLQALDAVHRALEQAQAEQ